MRWNARTIADRAAAALAGRSTRRSFLVRSAVVGSALATSGLDYVLRPGSAYASVCGSGASCGDGWTAMCCTIHKGVNQCPPGSFAGGWWKADGASLCGGHARYYIDCQAECTQCGCGGGSFCGQHCWNCRPHCADGDCDKRRVCTNVFRYGQCERERACSGPVLCRTISCTPPWEWLSCSTTSATDQATVSHSASCLSPWGPILARYTSLGSQGSVLGASVGKERRHGKAVVQDYQHGRMYYAKSVGAHWLAGAVLDKYEHHHDPDHLGLPTSDLKRDGGDAHAKFQHGTVTHRHGEPAHAIWGHVDHKWHLLHGFGGPLGWPASDNHTGTDGTAWARFETGTIVHRPGASSARAVWGGIEAKWRQLHAQSGVLGWPKTDVEPTVQDGSLARFDTGTVTTSTGTHAVWGPIDTAWRQHGGPKGSLGLPTTDVYEVEGGDQQADFQGGSIVYDPSTGEITILPPPSG
jgi:hypothetical protein